MSRRRRTREERLNDIRIEDDLTQRLVERGVIMGPDHFVLGDGFGNPGRHSSHFVNADRFYASRDLFASCAAIVAAKVRDWNVGVIVAPDDQSMPVARLIARHLAGMYRLPSVECYSLESDEAPAGVERVLIHDDVVSRGRQSSSVIQALQGRQDRIVGISCLFRRIKDDVFSGLPIAAAVDFAMPTYKARECPLCQAGVPVNVDFGKGAFFAAQLDHPNIAHGDDEP